MSDKTILVTASTFPRWQGDGTPPFVLLLSKHLSNLGYRIIVLVPHSKGAKFHEILEGVTVYRFPYFFPLSLQTLCYNGGIMANIKKSFLAKIQVPLFLVFQFLYVSYLLIKYKPDLIHAHWIIPQGIVVAPLSFLTKIPIVMTVHGSDVTCFQSSFLKKFVRFFSNRASIITVNSKHTLQLLQSTGTSTNSELIPMGVEAERFRTQNIKSIKSLNPPNILFIGRLVEIKGAEYLIRAMQTVQERVPNATLTIVGEGPLREKLEQLAKDLCLNPLPLFLGAVSNNDLPGIFLDADVFVGSSIVTETGETEAFGIVYLEALSSGTPVIATKVGGISDIITNEVTGLLVEQKDSQALAQAILKVLLDNELITRFINNGLHVVNQRFSWDMVAKKFATLYEAL